MIELYPRGRPRSTTGPHTAAAEPPRQWSILRGATSIAIMILHRIAFEQRQLRFVEIAEGQAYVIEAVARVRCRIYSAGTGTICMPTRYVACRQTLSLVPCIPG